MLIRRVLPLVLTLLLSGSAAAQQKTVSLQVMVYAEGEQHPFDGQITVTLLDSWGLPEGEASTRDGIVEFMTNPDLHRLKITGTTIDQYDGDFTIEPNESSHTERVTVLRRRAASAPEQKGTIPAVRLHMPKNARKEYEKGKAKEGKDWAEARKHYENAVALYPDYDLAYNSLGVAALRTGDKAAALQAFSKAVSVNSSFVEAYHNLARVLMADKKYPEMEEALKKAVAVGHLDVWGLTFLAFAEFHTGKTEDAIAHARKVHTLPHAGLADAHLILAQALDSLHQTEQALQEYKLYLVEAPNGSNAGFARQAVVRLSSVAAK
ncbi:MAG TPA: tetratricopeptide repeat protein [Terriglobales bacterium]|nr:tetratricopeptide repeat protein [Terriglobales bacterium]